MRVQALSSPVSGVLGDKVDRTHIVALGCFLWGVMTAAIGMSHSLHQVWLLSLLCFSLVCVNGDSLAPVHLHRQRQLLCHSMLFWALQRQLLAVSYSLGEDLIGQRFPVPGSLMPCVCAPGLCR